jgi:uncharacterized protein with GYD domain
LSCGACSASIDLSPSTQGAIDRRAIMAKYLFKVRYTSDGLEGVMSAGGSARRAAADDLAKNLGGSIEAFYFAFGDDDAFVIADLPDNQAAAKLAMTVSASGRLALTTVPLLTVDEVDNIAGGQRIDYTAPGR